MPPRGFGGSYFLKDPRGQPRWVVKPVDEEMRGPNHWQNYYRGPDVISQRHKPDVPPLTPCSENSRPMSSRKLGALGHLRPLTLPAILDFSAHPRAWRFNTQPKKLCSVQQFVGGSMHVLGVVETLKRRHKRIDPAQLFDLDAFQLMAALTWGTYDNDNNLRNMLVVVRDERR